MTTRPLFKFKTEADYKTAKKNHLILPNISSVEETGNRYINGRFTTKRQAEAGTIIAYHEHSTGEKEIKYIVPEAFNKNDTYWKADAVVVVPYSHTGDGTVRAMGLTYASVTTPATGGAASGIAWGASASVDIAGINNYTGGIKFADYNDQTSSSTYGTGTSLYLPSDAFSGDKVNPYDTETIYHSTSDTYAPSPYNEDGSKNDAYHSLGDFAVVTDNVLRDMDGKGNTLAILRTLDQEYLGQTLYADTLDNVPYKNYNGITLNLFPAACACARYSSVLKPCTIDTNKTLEENIAANAMPWYLPACGEVGYSFVRQARIQYAMEQVGATTYDTSSLLWSSSEYAYDLVWTLNPSVSDVYYYGRKYNQYMVRPFAAF